LNTTNFYWIDAVKAIFKILDTWGGSLVDTIELNENNEIVERKILIVNRLGADRGLLIQSDYNAETIERRTLSYPVTAMWGQGSSLEIEDEQGQHTGGYTRYIHQYVVLLVDIQDISLSRMLFGLQLKATQWTNRKGKNG